MIPDELRYHKEHEWVRMNGSQATVGISHFAQDALGDVVFVELPEVGGSVAAADEVAVVESVKAASDIYAPVGGDVIAINSTLEDAPETVNSDPYNDGWFFKLQPADASELDKLMNADDYDARCAEES